MNIISTSSIDEVVVIGIQPGELLLESIRDALAEKDIRNGCVISGVGTLKRCTMHYIQHTDFPPADVFYTLEKPLEVLSVNGVIADGEPHLHIVVSCGENEVYAGHLEDNCEVAYLAEIAILKTNACAMERPVNETYNVKLLQQKK
jgi:hypothetical protein